MRSLNTTTFTERDYQTVQGFTPPGRIFQFLALTGLRLGLGDSEDSISLAYTRAEHNADRLLTRQDLPEHLREHLQKYRKN